MIDPKLLTQAQDQINTVPNITETKTTKSDVDNTRCLLNIVMTKSEKKDLKVWCENHDVSMNFFIKLAIDDLQFEVENGKKSISKTGVRAL